MSSKQNNKNKKHISPDRLSKAALGLFAGAAFLLFRSHDNAKPDAQTIEIDTTRPIQLAECYNNCYAALPEYSSERLFIPAAYHPFGECPAEGPECGDPGQPACPPIMEPCEKEIDGRLVCDLFNLYSALKAGRPDAYPYTYVRDRYGIPTVSTPFSLENLRILVDEALRIGPPYGYKEKDGPFMRYVRDTIANGDPNGMIDQDNWVLCYWTE